MSNQKIVSKTWGMREVIKLCRRMNTYLKKKIIIIMWCSGGTINLNNGNQLQTVKTTSCFLLLWGYFPL